MSLLTASVRELTNARALDVALVDANGDQLTTFDVNVVNATPAPPATAALTSVASSIVSVLLLASNANRKKFVIFNDSIRTLRVAFAATASATAFSVLLASGGSYVSAVNDYTGDVAGIWNIANGFARVTEITP